MLHIILVKIYAMTIIKNLPDAKNYDILSILEPAIGVGNFFADLNTEV